MGSGVHAHPKGEGTNIAYRCPTPGGMLDAISQAPLDNCPFAAYTSNMSAKHPKVGATPCLCGALRQASRAVSRLYDEELRGAGLRTTQYSLLCVLARVGPVRQGDLSALTSLDETTLTRNLRPLLDAQWIAIRSGDDRREKLVTITNAGTAKLAEAHPAWERAQKRMEALLPEGAWQRILAILPEIAKLTAGD
jgi:DNA-binding MarR family transcriptional regulator